MNRVAPIAVLLASLSSPAAAAPQLTYSLSSNDQLGVSVAGKPRGRAASAMLGLWSDDGALELGGFRDGPPGDMDPSVSRAFEIVSGRAMQSRGIRVSGTIHRGGRDARGWSFGVEARRQRMSDVGAALSGSWRTAADSRLSLSGKLKF
jgi:hypothetical protein